MTAHHLDPERHENGADLFRPGPPSIDRDIDATWPPCMPAWSSRLSRPACWTWPTGPSTPRWAPSSVAATPTGLVRVAYPQEDPDAVLAGLAARVSPRILNAPERLDDAARQLEEYFTGRLHRFELPLDMRLSSGFRRTVLDYLPAIPYGSTATYAGGPRRAESQGGPSSRERLCHQPAPAGDPLPPGRPRRRPPGRLPRGDRGQAPAPQPGDCDMTDIETPACSACQRRVDGARLERHLGRDRRARVRRYSPAALRRGRRPD